MNPQKEKGRRLELKVAQLIREKGLGKAYRMPYSGGSEFGKGDVWNELGLHIECKNKERISIFGEWQKIRDFQRPVLIMSRAYGPILAVMDIEMFLDLLKKSKDYNKKED